MTEKTVDNTIQYSKASGWKMLAFLCVFLIAGIVSTIKFDNYLTDFWKIRNCNPEGYARGDFMWGCGGIKVDRYAFGSIYLGSQKNAVKNAKTADVVVFGNSRTMRSFSTDAIDNYFKNKGLTYVIFAIEGASYASALHTIEKLNLNPKIVLTNNEILFSNVVGDAFGDLVYFPDKYETRFDFFHAAQSLQKWACQSSIKKLEDFYCQGSTKAVWRSAVTGRFEWDLIAEPEDNIPFTAREEKDQLTTRMSQVLLNAKEFTSVSQFKESCQILYLVNSPKSEPNLMKAMGNIFEIDTVYADGLDLKSYDESHMDRPFSEAWAAEFVKVLDPAIDHCFQGGGQPNFDKFEAYLELANAEQAEIEARREEAIALRKAQLEAKAKERENAEAARLERLKVREELEAEAIALRNARLEAEVKEREDAEAARLERLKAREELEAEAIALRNARLEAEVKEREDAEAALQERLKAREERDAEAIALRNARLEADAKKRENAEVERQERLKAREELEAEAIALRNARLEADAKKRENAEAARQERLKAREELEAKAAELLIKKAKEREERRISSGAVLAAKKPKGTPYAGPKSDTTGKTNFETWQKSKGIKIIDAASTAPNGEIKADKIILETPESRIRYIFREKPIKAGTTMRFGAWFWSDSENASVLVQLIRSCSPNTPNEWAGFNSVLNNQPHRLEVSHTFKYDHDCALVQILARGEGSEISVWQGRTEFSED